jgi:hypothetical protein
MKKTIRIIYLIYHLKTQNWSKYFRFCKFVKSQTKLNIINIIFQSLFDSIKYNISPLEYFYFRFYNKKHDEKIKWAGTGTMYEYQLIMNPKLERGILDDKRRFFKEYSNFVLHKTASKDDLIHNPELINNFFSNKSNKVVFKKSNGKCGAQVEIINTSELDKNSIINYMNNNDYDLIEEFIVQHKEMNRLSPSGVNTVRIFSQLDKDDKVVILGCRQRISVNSSVDNMAAGNLVAAIVDSTGIINTKAFYSDITKEPEVFHPVTGVKIPGFQIPFWPEVLTLVQKAALAHKQNRSIGWDIVITENGPGLIEGNHDWCKLVWQMPIEQGLKNILDKHLKEFNEK